MVGDIAIRMGRELRATKFALNDVQPEPITPEARESFEQAFGFTVDEQHAIEAGLKVWSFDIEGGVEIPQEWTKGWVNTDFVGSEWYPLRGFNDQIKETEQTCC